MPGAKGLAYLAALSLTRKKDFIMVTSQAAVDKEYEGSQERNAETHLLLGRAVQRPKHGPRQLHPSPARRSPGVKAIKRFLFISDEDNKNAIMCVLVPGKPFQSGLLFAGKVRIRPQR
jgi:hypothetical protein